jgi:hypothetical protein
MQPGPSRFLPSARIIEVDLTGSFYTLEFRILRLIVFAESKVYSLVSRGKKRLEGKV